MPMSDILHYRILRLRFAVLPPLTESHPPALLSKLASVFESAGIPLAMSKEKRPKPIAHLAYPLPIGVEGLEEWADLTLKTGLSDPPEAVIERLRACRQEGLEILGIEQVPLHASSVAELCETAHWLWNCRAELSSIALSKLKKFADSSSFQINKTGKVEGRKDLKTIEVRHLIQELNWDGGVIRFSTKIVQGQALNPKKLFAAILDVEQDQLGEFRRESIELKPDPKLDRFDKFAPKLRNLYEDAVLLESAPNIKIYDNDEDDLLSL